MHYTSDREKPIRRGARARIRAVPLMRAQWQKNRSPLAERISAGFGVLIGAVFIMGFPAAMANTATEGGQVDWPVMLGTTTMSLAICVGLASWFLNELTESNFLGVSCLLPVSDASIVRNLTGMYIGGAAATLVPTIGFWGMVAWSLTESWQAVGIASVLAVVQAVLHGAIGLLMARWCRRWCNPVVLLALVLVALGATFGINAAEDHGMPNADAIIRPVTEIMPTGWTLACILEAVVNSNATGWLYLIPAVPVAVAAIFAANQLAEDYRIVELELLEGATARVHDEQVFAALTTAYACEDEDECRRPVTALRAEVRSRDFLTTDPEAGGIIERLFYDMLSDEERRSIDVLTGGEILRLTRRVTLVAITVVFMTALAILADAWLAGWGGLSIIGVASWLVCLFLLSRPECAILNDRSMMHCGTMALLPVDWPRFQRVVNLAGILQSVFLLPLSFLVSGIGLWALRGHLPWFEAVSLGFKPLLILIALHQFWMQFLLPLDPKGDRRIADLKQGFDLLLTLMFLAGAVSILIVDFSSLWSIPATGLLFGSGWLHQRYYRWLILKRYTELMAFPADIDTSAGMGR